MHRPLRWLVGSALLGAVLLQSSCGKREDPMVQAAREGILYFGNGTEVQDIDPQTATGVPEHKVLLALGEGLLTENPADLTPVPGVATHFDVSADGLTYTFHLRPDAKWSNGDPLTAQDFLLSYKRILTRTLAAEYANMIYDFVENAKEYFLGEITDFSQVGFRVVDEHTLVIRLKNPTPFLPRMIAGHYSWYPVPVKVIERFGGMERRGTAWTRPENFLGNGPFRIKEWRPRQVFIVEKNPHYWDRDRVRLNEIWFFPTENQASEERDFRTGKLHRTNEVPLPKIDAYREEKSPMLHIDPWLGSYFYRFNTTRPPFTDVRVRRAFALAIDREMIVNRVTKGGQAPGYRFTPGGFPGYEPKVRLEGTVEEARQLLAEAGYPGGEGLPAIEVLYNTHEGHKQIAEVLQEMWRQNLGVRVTLRNEEWGTYLDSQDNLNFSLSRSGWIADYPHPYTFLDIFVTGGGNNDTGWSNAEYDALRQQSFSAATDEERFKLYERMEQILMDELPILPIYHYTKVYLLHPSVKGWHSNPLDNHPFKYLWLEVPGETATTRRE